LEEAAREARYDFLDATADQVGAPRIATGHTLNDQAETLLVRLLQGAGRRGLAGIHPRVEGRVIRPLLEVERQDLEEYLRERGGDSVLDETNLDRRFFRNRIRLDLLPLLAEEYNPEVVRLLARTADVLREEDGVLDKLAEAKAEKVFVSGRRPAGLEANALARLPRGLARRLIRRFIQEEKGDLRNISFDDVEDVLSLREEAWPRCRFPQGRRPDFPQAECSTSPFLFLSLGRPKALADRLRRADFSSPACPPRKRWGDHL
jgi:tRNA(Ile)-lysidine synthase